MKQAWIFLQCLGQGFACCGHHQNIARLNFHVIFERWQIRMFAAHDHLNGNVGQVFEKTGNGARANHLRGRANRYLGNKLFAAAIGVGKLAAH